MANAFPCFRSLVAWYGPKPALLADLISECQRRVALCLGRAFHPYELEQVHSTLISLDPPGVPRPAAIDLVGLLGFIEATGRLAMQIQVGGFADRPHAFTSREKSPYARSFVLHEGKTVIIGWPLDPVTGAHPLTLDALRRELQPFGVCHHYHRTPTDIDNDAYFRIGLYDAAAIEKRALESAEAELRRYLSERPPTIVEIAVEDLSLAISSDETLARHSTKVFSIPDAALQDPSLFELGVFELGA